jgi:plastocyanin
VLGHEITSTITALDSRTNTIVWQERKPGADNKGAMSTAGDLVFSGQPDGNFVAYNVRTGEKLWTFQTGWGIGAPPMTYEVDGVQYVTVAAGGNRGGITTLDGDAVWTFSLNGTMDEVTGPGPVQTKVTLGTGAPTRVGQMVGGPTTLGGPWTYEGTVRTIDFRFDPQRVGAAVGETVNWFNEGSTLHTVTEQNKAFDSGDLASGASFSWTPAAAGSYVYICVPHPWMIGEVVVG